MSILCRIGIHRWLELGTMLIVPWVGVSECLRCHRRKADYGYATVLVDPPPEGWNDYLELNWTLKTGGDGSQ